jgi:hypothetical protein
MPLLPAATSVWLIHEVTGIAKMNLLVKAWHRRESVEFVRSRHCFHVSGCVTVGRGGWIDRSRHWARGGTSVSVPAVNQTPAIGGPKNQTRCTDLDTTYCRCGTFPLASRPPKLY